MMNPTLQNSLIVYITSHTGICNCQDCQDNGGVKNLLDIFEQENFTDNNLRRIYSWLKIQFKFTGTCDLGSLDFNNPTAPKLSEIVECHLKSYINDEEGNLIPLKKQIYV